jgi:hypothetical protein
MQNMSCGSVRRLLRVAASFNIALHPTRARKVLWFFKLSCDAGG